MTENTMSLAQLAPCFQKLAEAATEISNTFATLGHVTFTVGKAPSNEEEGKKGKKVKKEKRASRAPTVYNLFMKKAVAEVKTECPGLSNKDVFAQCAAKWKVAKENPKNNPGGVVPAPEPVVAIAAAVEVEDDKKSKKQKKDEKDDAEKSTKKKKGKR